MSAETATPEIDAMVAAVKAKDREEFESAFLDIQKRDIPPNLLKATGSEEYVRKAGKALYDRFLQKDGKRYSASKAKRGLRTETALFQNRKGWRGSNSELATYFSVWFSGMADDLRNGTAGNPLGASRTIERRYVDQAVDAFNEHVTATGHPEWADAILKPGFKPNDLSSRPGEASHERSVLQRMVEAAGRYYHVDLDPATVKTAIRSRAKSAK